jgi:hypothetical protein
VWCVCVGGGGGLGCQLDASAARCGGDAVLPTLSRSARAACGGFAPISCAPAMMRQLRHPTSRCRAPPPLGAWAAAAACGVRPAAAHPREGGAPARIVQDLGDHALDVAIALRCVELAQLGGALAVGVVALEDGASTLTLGTDDATHFWPAG